MNISKYLQPLGNCGNNYCTFITCLGRACCCRTFCRQCAFWIWDKWTSKECIRHTRERCCIINNFNGARVQYNEIPQTRPVTLGLSHSLPVSFQESQQVRSGDPPEPRRRLSSRVNESWELKEFQQKPKEMKEEEKEKILIQGIQTFSKRGEDVIRCE